MSNIEIEKFGERLEAIVLCLVNETLVLQGETRNILQVSDIYRAMEDDPNEAEWREGRSEEAIKRSWERALHGTPAKDKGGGQKWSVPREYVNYIYELYPTVRGVLEGPLEQFEAFIAKKMAARLEWIAAARHIAWHRHDHLHALAKRYYRDVDETQRSEFPIEKFPLVAKASWILDEPLLLEEVGPDALPDIQDVPIPLSQPLEGIEISAMALKSSQTLRKRMRKTGDAHWNGRTYRMLGISRTNQGLNFDFGNGWYFGYVNACEARALELARADLRRSGEGELALPLRVAPNDIFNFLGRDCFPGVNCLTFIKNFREPGGTTKRDVYLVHFRDDSVMEAQNCVHVVPAGGHQPFSNDLSDREGSQIWRTVTREFLEELRNKKELDHHGQSTGKQVDDSELDHLFRREIGGRRAASIFLLGAGIDPVSTKPEILVAIVLDWDLASQRIDGLQLKANYEGKVFPVELADTIARRKDQLRAEARGFRHDPFGTGPLPTLAAGAACLLLAAEHYEKLVA